MKQVLICSIAAAVIGVGLLSPGAAVSQTAGAPWIRVEVNESGEEAKRVSVNLPLSLAEVALRIAPDDVIEGGMLELKDHDFKVEDLRALWTELKAAGEAEFVTVESDDKHVQIRRSGDLLQVRVVAEGGEEVHVDAPIDVIDALLSGTGEALNLGAAIERLRDRPGEIVRVLDGETQVRVWVEIRS